MLSNEFGPEERSLVTSSRTDVLAATVEGTDRSVKARVKDMLESPSTRAVTNEIHMIAMCREKTVG
jgi:hypothetical protein